MNRKWNISSYPPNTPASSLTILSHFHSPGVTRWCRGMWRGWAGPARHSQVDRWSSGGRPPSHHSCLWDRGAPGPARGLGQSLLCPGNGWTPSHWHWSAAPACPRGGGPVHQSWTCWTLPRSREHRCCLHLECSSAAGEGWTDSYICIFLQMNCENRGKKQPERFMSEGMQHERIYQK